MYFLVIMTPQEIKKKVLKYKWEFWLERPFAAFYLSLFIGGNARKSMQKIGVDVEHRASLFDSGCWWQSDEVYKLAAKEIAALVPGGLSVKKVSESCEKYREDKRAEIQILLTQNLPPLEKFKRVVSILQLVTSYIWLAHDFEYYYTPILKKELKKYFKGDIDLIIGDLSFPEKKNSHNYLEDELRAGRPTKELVEEYGWIKVRDGFSDPFTEAELEELRAKFLTEQPTKVKKIKVPKLLEPLIKEVRELVYFRTLRTDVFYELMFLARPIVAAVGELYGLAFKDLRNYSVYDLLSGKLIQCPEKVTCAYYKNETAFFNKSILPKRKISNKTIEGKIAYKGRAVGRAKIVKNVEDLPKVNTGDILVTHMTSPNYLSAMQKAAAFVTDEGGITCHAAIVAREMKKPCIIGTKYATKVFRDGDLIEVDANKGVVKIIPDATIGTSK